MSAIKGQVSSQVHKGEHFDIQWIKAPHGRNGEGEVEIAGQRMTVRWSRDADGLWVEFPHGAFGFDVSGEPDEEAGSGLVYRVAERGNARIYTALKFQGAGETALATGGEGKKKALRVRAQMPGKIVRILVKAGDEVAKDQPLIVMEAMKMENEIRAANAGKVETIKVTEGQAVESGADLILIG